MSARMQLVANFLAALTLAGSLSAAISADKELRIGEQMAAQIQSTHKLVSDSGAAGFVTRVIDSLTAGETLRFPPKLILIRTPKLVVSALPGGFVVVSSGAILRAGTEAELAALLAHAVAHGQAELSTSSTTGLPLIFMGSAWGLCARSGVTSHVLIPASMTQQIEEREAQADTLALAYMTKAGYDPESIARGSLSNRVTALSAPAGESVVNTSRFEELKARLKPSPISSAGPPTLRR